MYQAPNYLSVMTYNQPIAPVCSQQHPGTTFGSEGGGGGARFLNETQRGAPQKTQ